MSITTRQTSLFAVQDWTKLYETFRSADFQSYDFETLRKTMIDYLQLYYPEDFNDFIESSEYIALIDMIAFLGQSLAFRADLNARENFIDTAERRDSILRLARLISYNPNRNQCASGFLKISTISTTETIYDSVGNDLTNLAVTWNDYTNADWQDQFNTIVNATLVSGQVYGKPGNSLLISNIQTDEYSINFISNTVPVISFTSSINGTSMPFEIINPTTANQSFIYENAPSPNGTFNVLFKNDGQGNTSNNTGFFLYFKQGQLQTQDFNITNNMPNRVINVTVPNINNSDVWLYSTNSSGYTTGQWVEVSAVSGINVIYNENSQKNLFQVNSRLADQIDLVFGDGSFANIPYGTFRLFYRISNGTQFNITPDEMQAINFNIPYISKLGKTESLSISADLMYTITNAAAADSIDDIRQKAPQQYYTQNRMVTGEDYNILPYTTFNDIVQVKAINRSSSGISRYLDLIDPSGTYSSTRTFSSDGIFYKETEPQTINFTYSSTAIVASLVQQYLTEIVNSHELLHFYYATFPRQSNTDILSWTMKSLITNGSTGYITDPSGKVIQVNSSNTNYNTNLFNVGTIIKFVTLPEFTGNSSNPQYFNAQNALINGTASKSGDKNFIYAAVTNIYGDGTNGGIGYTSNGQGAITLNTKIPSNAVIAEFMPRFSTVIDSTTMYVATQNVLANNNFGIGLDTNTASWYIINQKNINQYSPFTLTYAQDNTNQNLDSSWLIMFQYTANVGYVITYKSTQYVFGSTSDTRFYYDPAVKVYDSHTSSTIYDTIDILKINNLPQSPYPLGIDVPCQIYKNIVDSDGYADQSRILVTYTDSNNDGIPDNPDIFSTVVDDTSPTYIYFQNTYDNGYINPISVDQSLIEFTYGNLAQITTNVTSYPIGQIFYATEENNFYVATPTLIGNLVPVLNTTFFSKIGRQNISFKYSHNSPDYRRIDPTPNNIIDIYLLTKGYASLYSAWATDATGTLTQPSPPTSDELYQSYGTLENYKAISDTIIFNSAIFKPLFGALADPQLQAIFKVIKNPSLNISDNDIKSSVISAINAYFSIGNWSFGDTFYFSELSAYLHTTLSPNLSGIILVPMSTNANFGSLYQINSESNEILISVATVDNVQVITDITAAQINSVTSSTIF